VTGTLLDTNVLSELVRPQPDERVVTFVREHGNVWLSVIVLHELTYGAERATSPVRRARLLDWISSMRTQFAARIIHLDEGIAETAGRMRACSEASGRPSGPLDAFIAASAGQRGLSLATRNTKDFETFGVELVNPWEPLS
jgi:predicted nucleic acid-binding protein